MPRAIGVFVCVVAGLFAAPALALIQVLLPLETLIQKEADYIMLAEVDQVDPARPAAVIVTRQTLKGKPPFERIPVNLKGDELKHTPQLLKRIAPKLPLVLFVGKQPGDKYMMLAYTDGTWFQAVGDTDGERVRWGFTHCEIYLRRTFKGSTAELQQVVSDALSGKKRPPRPDAKVPPGFGPELSASR
jgi:hypothetical protein